MRSELLIYSYENIIVHSLARLIIVYLCRRLHDTVTNYENKSAVSGRESYDAISMTRYRTTSSVRMTLTFPTLNAAQTALMQPELPARGF